MSKFDRPRVSRLPDWRSHDPARAASEPARLRSPVIRPGDFVAPKPAPLPLDDVEPEFLAEAESTVERRDHIAPPAPMPAAAAPPLVAEVAGPLLDIRSVIWAIWNRRLIVAGLAVLCAAAGALVLPTLPQKFTAGTSLYFDPRQIGLSDPATQGATVAPEMISTLIDSQVQILTSGTVLRRVADVMKLDEDPEFNGGRSDGAAVIGSLQKALVISRQAATYVVSLAVTTSNPEKSANLANQVVKSFMQEETNASSGLYENTSTTLDGRLTDLRQRLQDAEQAVETFRADNDMAATQGNLISDQRLASLNTLLVTAQEKTIQAKTRADAAANLSVDDLVGGSQTDGTNATSALTSLRQQYATQAAIVGSLESQMGTRHPRLQSARSSLQSMSGEIKGEIQRLASTAKADYDQAKKAEDAVAKELAVQKALQASTSDKQVALNELQRKATAARDIYETVLKRSSQTSEEQNLNRSNIRVISQAEAPLKPNGPGKKVLLIAGLIGGLFAGFALGAGFAVLFSLFSHPIIKGYFRRSPGAAA